MSEIGVLKSTGEAFKQQGMDAALDHTPVGWKRRAHAAAEAILEETGFFSSEDLIERVGMPPNSPNAVGAMVHALARKLGLRKDHRVPNTTRPSCHAAEVCVWTR